MSNLERDNHRLQLLRSGDRIEMKRLYNELLPRVSNYIKNNRGTTSEALDVFHQSLETLIVGRQTLRSSLDGLILQMCKNKWIDIQRKKQRDKVRNDELQRHFSNESNVAQDAQALEAEHLQFQLMEQTFGQLSEKCQTLLEAIKRNSPTDVIVKEMGFSSANTMYRRKWACLDRWSTLIKQMPSFRKLNESWKK